MAGVVVSMRVLFMIFFFLCSGSLWAQKGVHEAWGRMLQTYVSESGDVNYSAWKEDRYALDAYIEALARNAPAKDAPTPQRMAFWINAYNALTVQLILNNYPLESIRDLYRPWGRTVFQIGDQSYSLGAIEHRILRKMGDPRIHFAINCASASCPKLSRTVYTGRGLEQQLQQATQAFLTDPSKNEIEGDQWRLSRIFLWFGQDFGGRKGKIAFIKKALELPQETTPELSYKRYDWGLNQAYNSPIIQ